MLLLLVGTACIFPLSLYCLGLAMVHHRKKPTAISGAWDFAAVVLGLSGFLLVGTSVFLLSLNPFARSFFLGTGSGRDLVYAYRHAGSFTLLLWAMFYLTLATSLGFAFWQRRGYTVVYHVAPWELERLMQAVCDRLQMPVTRRGPRWFLGYEAAPARSIPKPVGDEDAALVSEFDSLRKAVVDIDGSDAMRCVTLHWRFCTQALRREIETELSREFAHFHAGESSAGKWLMTAAGSLFILMAFSLVTFLILVFR